MNKSFLIPVFMVSLISQSILAFDMGGNFLMVQPERGPNRGTLYYRTRDALRFTERNLNKILAGTLLALVGYKVGKFCKLKWDERTNTKALETIQKIAHKHKESFAALTSTISLSEAEQLKAWSTIILNKDAQDSTFSGYLETIINNIKKLENIVRSTPSQYDETKQQAQKLSTDLRQLQRVVSRFCTYLRATSCFNHVQKAFEQTANQILTASTAQQQEQNLHQAVRKNRLFNDSKFKYINFEVALNAYIAQLYAFSKLSVNDNLQCFAPVQQNINTLLEKLNDVLALLLSTHEHQEQHTLYREEQERQALIRRQQQLIEEQNKRMEDLQFALYREMHRQNMRRFNY